MTDHGYGTYPGDRECPRCGTRWILLVDRPHRQPLRPMTCGPCRTRAAQHATMLTNASTEPLDEPLGEWAAEALCLQIGDPDLFFPEKGYSAKAALKVCRACQVTTECLDYALRTRQLFGIWGATSSTQRRLLLGLRVSA